MSMKVPPHATQLGKWCAYVETPTLATEIYRCGTLTRGVPALR